MKLIQSFSTVTPILFQNSEFCPHWWKSSLLFESSKTYTLLHYCCKLADWILAYWKLRFFSSNFKMFKSQKTTWRILMRIAKFISKRCYLMRLTG